MSFSDENLASEKERDGANQSGRSIAIVDDDPAVVVLVAQFLRQKGFDAIPVVGSSHMLEMLATPQMDQLDFALIDYIMPGLDGVQLAEKIVKEKPTVKILITSADLGAEEKARQAGYDFLPKPFSTEELVRKISSLKSVLARV